MFTNQNRDSYLIILSAVILWSVILPLSGIAVTCHAEGLIPNESRLKFTLNDNWRFYKGDRAGSEQTELNDSTWQKINLPHTWNADDDFSKIEEYDRETGWYRKTFTLPGDVASKRIYIYFEAANQVADVYLNGKLLGQHKGGYSGFVFDITDHIKRDLNSENMLSSL